MVNSTVAVVENMILKKNTLTKTSEELNTTITPLQLSISHHCCEKLTRLLYEF